MIEIIIFFAGVVVGVFLGYRWGHDKGHTKGLLEGAAVDGGVASPEGSGGTRPVIR